MRWIEPDEPPAREVVNPGGRCRVILTCDHASARIPRRLGTLGVRSADLRRHIAWDVGAATVARQLSERLDAPLVLSGYSRLVVDCNRPLSAPDAFATRSEDVDIPGNAGLDEDERRARADHFYWPFHDAIDALVTERSAGTVPILVAVHSFTPVYHDRPRPWDAGLLYRNDRRLAGLTLRWLRAGGTLHVGENVPYRMTIDGDFTIPVHAERRGLPGMLVEIRQDHLGTRSGAAEWAERLGTMLRAVLDHPTLRAPGPRATDVHEPRYG